MSEEREKHFSGPQHQGGDSTAPYPVSRLAPSIGLVDLARQIEQADTMLTNVAHGKLKVLAEQIQRLQQQALAVMEQVKRDQQLHHARCNFVKRPGSCYHLYARDGGESYLSMLGPDEWGGEPPHRFEGSYRLEADMSWQPLEEVSDEEDPVAALARLLGR